MNGPLTLEVITSHPKPASGAPVGAPVGARVGRDRLEMLTALIDGPRFDPLFRGLVLVFPPDHPTYRWRCLVAGCERSRSYSYAPDLCLTHARGWSQTKKTGTTYPDFMLVARPLRARSIIGQAVCRICRHRPATSQDSRLCLRHRLRWQVARRRDSALGLGQWCTGEVAFPGFGDCLAVGCSDLAATPLGLCRWHELTYQRHGRPGGAQLPSAWMRRGETIGRPVVVAYNDRAAFLRWCAFAPSETVHGRLDLRGLRPLVTEELRWGLFRHTEGERSLWTLPQGQSLINLCRRQGVNSLLSLDLDQPTGTGTGTGTRIGLPVRGMVKEMLDELRLVYFAPQDTREAGFLETEHFGVRFPGRRGHFDLTMVSQGWLRELLWDFLAEILRSPKCPRSAKTFDSLRQACAELSAFLQLDAPGGGHDPTVLDPGHMHRFVADQRHRERLGLASLAIRAMNGTPTIVTAQTRANALAGTRRVLRAALDAGHTEVIGLDRGFVVAAPQPAHPRARTRHPFPDEVARALAEETNLRLLAANYDPNDSGLRDIWQTLIATGRRLGEVVNLRLDCTSRHNGLPMLWHDQTKVGQYDQAIRIPETIEQLLAARRAKTIAKFVQWNGRPPTGDERAGLALFVTGTRNRNATKSICLSTFNRAFRDWVDQLDLGARYVSHQARHTLATNLLRHGAELHHIRRYLGHVSEVMTEHYAKIALSEIEDVLQHVWVAGPAAPNPGALLSATTPMNREQAQALALDLSRRATPAEGGFCTFQPVVSGNACPWNTDCHNCDKFVLSGADLLYWRRKREQWASLAERAPDDATADYLHQVFAPTNRAIKGLEAALAAMGLLDDALALDLRRPQDYFNRIWATGFRAHDLAQHTDTATAATSRDAEVIA